MIKSIRDSRTAALYGGERAREYQAFQRQAVRRLQILDDATSLNDLKSLPSNRFEALHGKREGQFSIRISRQWRICFSWIDGDAHNVEITDYH